MDVQNVLLPRGRFTLCRPVPDEPWVSRGTEADGET